MVSGPRDPDCAPGSTPAVATEPWLRTGRMLELVACAPRARVLLVGEAEGLLASRMIREKAARVTWLEPAPGGAPFETEEFDAVASQFTIEYLEDPPGTLFEWRRVMKPGGTLALVTRNALYGGGDPRPRPRPRRSYSPEELRRLVQGSGFEVRGISTLIPDLRIPRLYRGDLSFSYRFERLPYFRDRGLLLFVSARARGGK